MNFRDVKALVFQRGWMTLSGAATIFVVPYTLTRPEQGFSKITQYYKPVMPRRL